MLTYKETLLLTEINDINNDINTIARNNFEVSEMICMIAEIVEEIGVKKYIQHMTLTNKQLQFNLN